MKAIPKAIFTFIIIALCSFAMGCEYLDARDAAHAGERALRRCEFSRAYWNFIYAQDVFPNHGDIRLGLAISDLLTFLSEPNVVALMERLGIDLRVESLCEDDSAVGGEPIEPPSNRDPNPGIEAPKCLVLNSLMQTTPGTVGMISALSMGFMACSDDSSDSSSDDKKANGVTCEKADECKSGYCNDQKKCADKPTSGKKENDAACDKADECKSGYCNDQKKCADKYAGTCDFENEYSAVDAKYKKMVEDGNLDAQTAIDRSLFGLIALTAQPSIQDVLKKLKFNQKDGKVSFRALWDNEKGIFNAMANKVYDADALDYLNDTLESFVKNNDTWYKICDQGITVDDIIDVLIDTKPQLESLAESFIKAGELLQDGSLASTGGCGLGKLEFSAQDMYIFATILYASEVAIEFLSNYDFSMSMAKLADYSDSDLNMRECKARTDLKDLLEPHLWKQVTKTHKKVGKSGIDALKEMAKVAKLALASQTSGKLINLSPVVASDVNIILDGIIAGTGSFGNLISPKIQMDFAKAFTNPEYRTEPLVVMSCDYHNPEYLGLSNLWDYIAVTYPNAVLNNTVFTASEVEDIDI